MEDHVAAPFAYAPHEALPVAGILRADKDLLSGGDAAVDVSGAGRLDCLPALHRHLMTFRLSDDFVAQADVDADALIDIWGADHAGTVKRIKAAVAALGQGKGAPVPFDVKLVQMVQLMRDGEPVKMSKRSGNFVTLADVVDEVGKDVVRFTMLTRKPEAQMDFDFAKVVEASKDNPVFYVQYAHARIRSTMRKAAEEDIAPSDEALASLTADDIALVKLAAQYPRLVESAAQAREPHRIAFYLYDLAAAFHSFWNAGNDDPAKRIIQEGDPELTAARLFLASQVGQVIRNGLAILGVEAVEEM